VVFLWRGDLLFDDIAMLEPYNIILERLFQNSRPNPSFFRLPTKTIWGIMELAICIKMFDMRKALIMSEPRS